MSSGALKLKEFSSSNGFFTSPLEILTPFILLVTASFGSCGCEETRGAVKLHLE